MSICGLECDSFEPGGRNLRPCHVSRMPIARTPPTRWLYMLTETELNVRHGDKAVLARLTEPALKWKLAQVPWIDQLRPIWSRPG